MIRKETRSRYSGIATFLALVSLIVAGCQLPDAGPFVDGTAALKGAVAASGTAVDEQLRYALEDTSSADKLKTNWEARNLAMTGMLRYAQSLAAIVDAGNRGAESAQQVADAVGGLAESAGIALPGSPAAIAVATDSVKFIAQQVAMVRAANELEQALDAAQPAVETIARLMREDLQDVSTLNTAAATLQTLRSTNDEVNTLLGQRKAAVDELATLDLSQAGDRASYAEITAIIAAIDARLAPFYAEERAIAERYKVTRAALDACDRAIEEWAAAHAELASAARNKRPVSARALVEAAVELRNLVERMRDL